MQTVLFLSVATALLVCKQFVAGSNPEQIVVGSAKPRPELRYFIYDVNPGEGFNLRRDVYLRAANIVKRLRQKDPAWVLVLPAWPNLYHWQSGFKQEKIPWRQFFEVDKLNEYVPVMEFEDYIKEYGPSIQQLFYLQNFPWKDGDEWKERLAPAECKEGIRYYQDDKGHWVGHFSGYNDVIVENLQCVSVLGDARLLDDFLLKKHDLVSVFVDRLESLMHVEFGQQEYWAARRSMVFARHLKDEAEKFMRVNLPKPENDKVKGWRYMAVHLRRKDYVWYDRKDVPTLQGAIDQLKPLLKEQGLDALFVASDAPEEEIDVLRKELPVFRYKPTPEKLHAFGDGGVAIIDQWICVNARYFIGSEPSTFSYRIQGERLLMGFTRETTNNRLCYDGLKEGGEGCEPTSYWPPV